MFQNFTEYKASYNDLYSILLHSIKLERSLTGREKRAIIDYLTRLSGEFSEIKLLLNKIKKSSWDIAEREINIAVKNNVDVVNILDPKYPANLKEIFDPPLVIFVRGKIENNIPATENPAADTPLLTIGIVGTRMASSNGKRIARKLAEELTRRKINIVSGLAYGIDTAAHIGAAQASAFMKMQQGLNFSPGIVILGSGVLSIYPKQNIELSEHLLELGGIIISEYGVFTPPQDFHFPARNRIISGLSSGVIIIEAKEKSGSLITARMALEQGREVFAIPGDIENNNSSGTNKLIQQGAALVTCTEDILNSFPKFKLVNIKNTSKPTGDKYTRHDSGSIEQKILDFIKEQRSCSLDDIIDTLAISPGAAVSNLNKLELEQLIFVHPGNIYSTDRFLA